jgi:heat shock protein HtpX
MRQREVEGVLAHEVAHIANGDMVTMTLLQGVLNTFVIFFSRVIGLLVDSFLQGNRRDEEGRSSGTGLGFFIGSLVAQIFLGLLASLVVMAYSRRREFAADAMAARIEGRDAMVGALQRLKMIHEGGGGLGAPLRAGDALQLLQVIAVIMLLNTMFFADAHNA